MTAVAANCLLPAVELELCTTSLSLKVRVRRGGPAPSTRGATDRFHDSDVAVELGLAVADGDDDVTAPLALWLRAGLATPLQFA